MPTRRTSERVERWKDFFCKLRQILYTLTGSLKGIVLQKFFLPKNQNFQVQVVFRPLLPLACIFDPKGWLAIAKLKPLSLFISLFQHCQMLSLALILEKWKVKVVFA